MCSINVLKSGRPHRRHKVTWVDHIHIWTLNPNRQQAQDSKCSFQGELRRPQNWLCWGECSACGLRSERHVKAWHYVVLRWFQKLCNFLWSFPLNMLIYFLAENKMKRLIPLSRLHKARSWGQSAYLSIQTGDWWKQLSWLCPKVKKKIKTF